MSQWPTPPNAKGSAPVVMHLLGSDDAFLNRQAAYLVHVGKALKESGYAVETFQQPLVDGGVSITVPLIIKNSKNLPAVVYTYADEWTAQQVSLLQLWLRDLRKAGVPESVPAIVVGHCASEEVARVPGVFQFIEMPQPSLGGERAP